jgi:hypothetical protein
VLGAARRALIEAGQEHGDLLGGAVGLMKNAMAAFHIEVSKYPDRYGEGTAEYLPVTAVSGPKPRIVSVDEPATMAG